jgi:hypothetical protein
MAPGLDDSAFKDFQKRGFDRAKRGVTYNDPRKLHSLRSVEASKIAWGWNWQVTDLT